MIDVTPFGDGRTLDAVADRADDLRPALEDIADAYRRLYGGVFATRGATAGTIWAPPTPGYRAYKAKAKPGRRPGVWSGLLEASLTRKGRHHVERIGVDSLTVGTSAPHAHLFADGRGGQKPRRLTPSKRRLETTAAEILQEHLSGGRFTGVL